MSFSAMNIIFAQDRTGLGYGWDSDDSSQTGGIPVVSQDCLNWMWKWCFSFDEIIHWENSDITTTNKNRTVMSVAQDIIFAATYMVWTILTIVIIYCGLMYIFAARGGKDVKNYKTWLINAGIWAVLVRWAYAIVRLIQYIAGW